MKHYQHTFHIPVMGLGYSADTPIRVAPFGISSVISITDDIVLEYLRKYYSEQFGLPYVEIPKKESDGRAKRITAYLNAVQEIVRIKMDKIKALPFFEPNDKTKYFEMLPDSSDLKKEYNRLCAMPAGSERDDLAKTLTHQMEPGSIDANIMVKLDSMPNDADGNPLGSEFSAAKSALRGYANSDLESGIVFSAGFNQGLFQYMPNFRDFYRDETGKIKKRIILKVSDYRSSLIQGRVLAKKGLEVDEFRIESGLNCGGHAFFTNGFLLPSVLREFQKNRDLLTQEFQPLIRKYYKTMGWQYPEQTHRPLITVQGGIGVYGEARRLMEDFGADRTGWATPFLLVPEATIVDNTTRDLLKRAGEKDLYLSNASPFGIPFNNLHNTGSEIWARETAAKGKPGSTCPKGLLVSNTEFTKHPICLGSRQYQKRKLKEIDDMNVPNSEKQQLRKQVTEKQCLCEHLTNSALIALNIIEEKDAPQSMCPGPNIAWFNRLYTLREMVDHIYGRCPSLVPAERPHLFVKEIEMNVDYFEKQISQCGYTSREIKSINEFKHNIEEGMKICLEIAKKDPYPDENLASIPIHIQKQRARLKVIFSDFEKNLARQTREEHNISEIGLVPSIA